MQNSDNGNWFVSFVISDDKNQERQIDLIFEVRYLDTYANADEFESFEDL